MGVESPSSVPFTHKERASVGASPWLWRREEILVGPKAVWIFGTVFVFFFGVCVCVHRFGSARGGAVFHFPTPPPMYRHCTRHHGRNQQLAGYMRLKLPCLPGKRENVSMGGEMKHFEIMHGIYMCVREREGERGEPVDDVEGWRSR